MARQLLGAIMYIENAMKKEEPLTNEENENVKMYLENVKSFPEKQIPKNAEIDTAIRLLIQFAGFEDLENSAFEKLKNLIILQFITIGRQLATAEKRKKDGLEIPYKSALQWTLKLHGIERVVELKEWYDSTYWSRFLEAKREREKK